MTAPAGTRATGTSAASGTPAAAANGTGAAPAAVAGTPALAPPTLLHHVLDAAASAHGDRPAVDAGAGEPLTYREVDAASRVVARRLVERGVARGDRVVLAVAPDELIPAVLYGCSRAGAAFCVLGEQAPAPAYAHVLDDAEPAAVITANADLRRLAAERGVACLTLDDLRAGTAADTADHGAGADARDTPDTADTADAADAADAVTARGAAEPLPVDVACLIYTSGSTGMPKAVVSTHAHMVFAATAIQSVLGYRADDVVWSALPLSFDYGLYQIFLATLAGARIRLAAADAAGPTLLTELRRAGATVLPAVPGMARGLARLLSRPGAEPPPLRLMTNTGSAMADGVLAELRARIPGFGVQLMFGLTECKRTTIMPRDEDVRRPGSVGRALPGTEVYAADDDGRRVPPGEIGELIVRGPHVMAGYWRRPELTAQRFPRVDGLFPVLRTGDYGWLDADGYLYFHGRRDDLYKERGFRVSATEVETAAARVDGVDGAALLPPGPDRAEALLVVATRHDPATVLELLRGELEEFKVPRHCVVAPAIPRNANGKIDRAAVARLLTETGAPAGGTGTVAPTGAVAGAAVTSEPATADSEAADSEAADSEAADSEAADDAAADGVPAGGLPAGIETPAYVYDLDELRRRHERLRADLPAPSELFYSLKANPHPAIVAALGEAGCHAEVCSPGELATALGAGVAADRVLYTGPGRRDTDVAGAIAAGVTWFSVDSPVGLDQTDRLARAHGVVARCLLRVNDTTPVPGQGLAMTGVASQFGADADWIEREPARFASRPHAVLAGFHLYMGTNVADEDTLVTQLAQSARTARRLADVLGSEPDVLDLGGGFAAPYARDGDVPSYPGLASRLAVVLDETFPGWRRGEPRVAFESGRHLAATCGTLHTRVLDVKTSHGTPVLVLESGINHLGGMAGLRRLPPVVPSLAAEGAAEPARVGGAIVAGPLCTPLDTWARGASVPAVAPGDLLRVPNVGAYGLTASLVAFLGHPAPVEVVVDGGRVVHTSRLTCRRSPTAAEEE